MIISRDKSLLYPPFAEQLIRFESELQKANLPFFLFMGLRTFEDQDTLYSQGRTAPGKIVTNARGGDSWHNYGLAADYVLDSQPDKPGLQWSWDLKADLNHTGHSMWRDMAEIAAKCGLEPGYFWAKFPDAPHVQNRYGLTLADAKELYRLGGIKKVWEGCKS
jgi:peptidoglycan L-alanyl-D-glutamate endopeptidase CwlK